LAYNFFLGYIRHIERELIAFSGAFLNRTQREVNWAPKASAHPEWDKKPAPGFREER